MSQEHFDPYPAFSGAALPHLRTEVPGPRSRALAHRLAQVESRNITRIDDSGPIFWTEARGANVRDADDNVFIDLTAGFAVAAAGHAHPRVARAIARQAALLPHALGDVHPAAIKLELLERLAALAPGALRISILASTGAEAVEAALKTGALASGKPGILAFEGSYHGLTYGALATSWRQEFRAPFEAQLFRGVRFAPYPNPYRATTADPADAALAAARRVFDEAERSEWPIGAVIVEPIQGRGGLVIPPPAFLPALRALCKERGAVLIFDEVYTGFGRTGRWFACEHTGVLPDVLVVGKALTGALPLSAAIGTPAVMAAWPPSSGEAIHTSTFLGNPIACAAALAQLRELEERKLTERAHRLGEQVRDRLARWRDAYRIVGDVRGLGLLWGIELVEDQQTKQPAGAAAARVTRAALRRGIVLLSEGPAGNVLAIMPPLVITEAQLTHALAVMEEELARAASP